MDSNRSNDSKPRVGWIIYPMYVSLYSDYAFDWLSSEAAHYGIKLKAFFLEDLRIEVGGEKNEYVLFAKGEAISEIPDFVLMRAYDPVISRFFEVYGITVVNSAEAMFYCKNKILTHLILAQNGFPTPKTVYTTNGCHNYAELCETLSSSKFIVKRMDGSRGNEVFLVENMEDFQNALIACKGECICQKYVENSAGRDIRVWVIGGKVAGSVMRYSDTSFKSNYSQGGQVSAYEIDDLTAKMCVDVCKTIGIEFAGIDLLFTEEDGFIVCEVNGNAGFRTLSLVNADNPIPRMLFEYINDLISK